MNKIDPATAAALYVRGHALYQAKAYKDAETYFVLLLASEPSNVNVCKLLGSCYQLAGYKRQAEELYRRALELAPNDVDALTNLGEILIAALHYDEALQLLRRAIELDPSYENPSSQRARALVMQVADSLGG